MVDVGAFDTNLRTCEDWDLWQRLARCPGTFVHVDEVLAFYRLRPGSASFDGARMMADGLHVLDRGHSRDPRVPDAVARRADGLPRSGIVTARLVFGVYCASLEIGDGRSPERVFEMLGDQSDPALFHGDVADAIFAALPIASGSLPDYFADVWREHYTEVAAMLAEFERRSTPGLAARAEQALEESILYAATGDGEMTIGRTQRVVLEVTEPTPTLSADDHVERLRCELRLEGEHIGSLELPFVDGRVDAGVLADAIVADHAWPILMRFLERRAGGPLADGDPETWGLFLRELWDRPDWPEPRFYEAGWNEPGKREERAVSGHVALAAHEPLPGVVAGSEGALVTLLVGGSHAAASRLGPGGRSTGQKLRAALTIDGGVELFRVAVREGLLGRAIDATPLRDRLAAAADAQAWPGTAPGLVLPRRLWEPTGTSGSRRALLPAACADDLRAMADAAGEPVGDGPTRSVAYAPDTIPSGGEWLGGGWGATAADGSRRAEFNAIFAEGADPWGYTSEYERAKYDQTLTLMPELPARVLEVACAEGHFTQMLARRAGVVVAADVSPIALERARRRCRDHDNVSFLQLDLVDDELPGGFDVVFCSEMLFYVGDRHALRRVARKLAGALRPGGVLITAHANAVVDDHDAPGFDWDVPFGAQTIGRALSATPGLAWDTELASDAYRIQRFERRAGALGRVSTAFARPRRERVEAAPMLPDAVATYRPHGGSPVPAAEKTAAKVRTVPILMYHRVAPEGPDRTRRWRITPEELEEQLDFLSDSGYRTITLDEWRAAAVVRKPLPERSVVLTFDDGYADFAEYAWPLLKRHGFGAMVFVVAGHVGGWNEWDAAFGDPVPLMDWDDLRRLQSEGVEFGSHTVSHPRLSQLAPEAIVRELVRSRTELERGLRAPIRTLAYPYGDSDGIVHHLTGACGYRYGLSCVDGAAIFDERLLEMPRIEVGGDDSLAQFMQKVDASAHPPTTVPAHERERAQVLA